MSPSARREWIEICQASFAACVDIRSPSARREWIEIFWLLRNEDRDSFPLEVKWIEIPGNWCHMKKMLMNFAANT